MKKVLIIDDEPNVRKVLKILLKSHNYDVITADDGDVGINTAKTEQPDVIVLDVVMPTLDGYSTCMLLKEDSQTREIPVIMLTARDSVKSKSCSESFGADHYLSKPYDSDELLELIDKFTSEKAQA